MAPLNRESGAEIVELALVTPILALLIAAMFDFGFLFRNWEIVTNAAREGARVGVLPSYSCDAGSPDVAGRVDAYMAGSGIQGGYSVNLRTDSVTAGEHTFNACIVNVALAQNLPSLSVIGSIFGGAFGQVTVAAAAVMRTENQAAAAP
jgi:hypothetical protein